MKFKKGDKIRAIVDIGDITKNEVYECLVDSYSGLFGSEFVDITGDSGTLSVECTKNFELVQNQTQSTTHNFPSNEQLDKLYGHLKGKYVQLATRSSDDGLYFKILNTIYIRNYSNQYYITVDVEQYRKGIFKGNTEIILWSKRNGFRDWIEVNYSFNNNSLKNIEKHDTIEKKCTCNMDDLMRDGCKCGGK